MLVELVIFSIFCVNKLKKRIKVTHLPQNLAKKKVFKFAPKAGLIFYSQILTSVWGAHHPNAGQNIQQTLLIQLGVGKRTMWAM